MEEIRKYIVNKFKEEGRIIKMYIKLKVKAEQHTKRDIVPPLRTAYDKLEMKDRMGLQIRLPAND